MKSLKRFSFSGLACLMLAGTLPVACQGPQAGFPDLFATTDNQSNTSSNTAAITGILYTGRAADGRLVPPRSPITIQVLDQGKEVASIDSDTLGRFFLDNIAVPKEGKRFTIRIANIFDQTQTLFPGRVLDLSAIQAQLAGGSEQARRVSGTLLDANGNPLAGATVRDKDSNFRSTVTNAQGEFVLEASGQELEVIPAGQVIPFSLGVEEFEGNPLVTIDTNNIRVIEGTLRDETNSNVFLAGVRIRVQGSNISTRTGEGGSFVLNGAPISPFTLEIEPPTGYAPRTLQIPPATFTNQQPDKVEQNLLLLPVGNIIVNFAAESSPSISCALDATFNYINPEAEGSCAKVLAADPIQGTYYNYLAVRAPQTAFIEVEGTDIRETVTYPIAPFYPVSVRTLTGETSQITNEFIGPNVGLSVRLENVPGGRRNITVSMTNFQTQKSIPIYVPPGDSISTERIILRGAQRVSSFGDVKGILTGLNASLPGEIRITYIDVGDTLSYDPLRGERVDPHLLARIQASLASGPYDVVNKQTGAYYLRNVPTGSRIMLAAAMVNADGTLSDCYIPNTSVLLNVRASEINLAPDMLMTARALGTGNCRAATTTTD